MKEVLPFVIFVVCGAVIVIGIFIGLDTAAQHSFDNTLITKSQLESIMDRSVAFESDGNLSLREAVKAKLSKLDWLTNRDYRELNNFADRIEKKAMVDMFRKDLYKYRSRGGLSVDLPPGYIEREKK